MKSASILFLLFVTNSVFATTNDLECTAALTNDAISRPAYFSYNEENHSYEAYRASHETGGIEFFAKQSGSKVQLVMSRLEHGQSVVLASKTFSHPKSNESLDLEVALESGHRALMSCLKND